MRFTPKTEKEVAEAGLFQPGVYDFEIAEAKDEISKNNNEMIVLNLKVYDATGNYRFVRDYLLESMPQKLRHVAYACGLGERYESGTLNAEDFIDRTGQVKIAIKTDKTGQYADQNNVRDYVIGTGSGSPASSQSSPHTLGDDDIPF